MTAANCSPLCASSPSLIAMVRLGRFFWLTAPRVAPL